MLFLLNEVLNVFFIWEAKFYFYSFFLITIKLTRWSANLISSHSYYFGIICGPIWGSFTIEDHLWSILGISCGWGSSYCTELRENLCHFLPYLKNRIHHYTELFSQVNLPLCISIYTLSDLGDLSNLIGSLSRTIQQYSPPSEWIMCELGVFPVFFRERSFKSRQNPRADFF